MRVSAEQILEFKNSDNKIVCITAYNHLMAGLLDEHADILLVGDSLGMVLYGYESTRQVTMDMMSLHAESVVRGSSKALVVVDMPFGSYEDQPEIALQNAKRLLRQTGAQAVKLEGGVEMADTIALLVSEGVEVMGHIGLLPQSVKEKSGYKVQGKTSDSAKGLMEDAKALEKAGVFSMVIEAVPESLAAEISASVNVPTIGIGASAQCDGQVLVAEDMLGLTNSPAKFVKRYADLDSEASKAAAKFAADVREGNFPTKDNCY